jgi:dTMP kinase
LTGAFITFEGIDGSGKSTQVRMLSSVLRLRGMDVVQTREPGGTPLGARLREALLDAQEQVDPLAELLLYAADRAQHVRALLLPALAEGRVVLSDRYADATVAYQGAGRGFEPSLVAEVVGLATGGLKPDLTLLFDLSVAASSERSRLRTTTDGDSSSSSSSGTSDRLELETENFHTRVRDAYLKIAAAEPERVRILDASLSVEEIHAHVLDIVIPFLESRGQWPQKTPDTKEHPKT